MMDVWLGISKSPKKSLEQTEELLQKSISIDENSDVSYSLLCHVYAMRRQFEKSLAAGQKAIEINPNSDIAYVFWQ
jgi:Tfp pilus assembly protein PilF